MGSIAQVKRDRQLQLAKLQRAIHDFDAKQEALERLVKRYRGKRKLLEASDMPKLNTAFSEMNQVFNNIERELINLSKVVAAV